MATGTITKSFIDTLLLDTVRGQEPAPIHISGNVYACAFSGPDSDGWLVTFSCSDAGDLGAVIGSLEYDTAQSTNQKISHVSGTTYVISYTGPPNPTNYYKNGILKTVTIQNDGTITGVVDSWAYQDRSVLNHSIVHVSGTIWCLSFYSETTCALATTVINADGTLGKAFIDSLSVGSSTNRASRILHLTGDIFVHTYGNTLGVGQVDTIEITTAGQIGVAFIDSRALAAYPDDLLELASGYYAVIGPSLIETFSVDGSGSISAAIDTQVVSAVNSPHLITLPNSTVRAYVRQSNAPMKPWLRTHDISNVGIIETVAVDSWNFDTTFGYLCKIIYISGSVYLVVYQMTGTSGPLRAVTIEIETLPDTPSDPMIRVTNLIHRYNRKQGIYELEMALGEVTSDFGLPQWLEAAMSAAPGDRTQDIIQEVISEISKIPYLPGGPPVPIPPSPAGGQRPLNPLDLFYGTIGPTSAKMTAPQIRPPAWEKGSDGLLRPPKKKNWWWMKP